MLKLMRVSLLFALSVSCLGKVYGVEEEKQQPPRSLVVAGPLLNFRGIHEGNWLVSALVVTRQDAEKKLSLTVGGEVISPTSIVLEDRVFQEIPFTFLRYDLNLQQEEGEKKISYCLEGNTYKIVVPGKGQNPFCLYTSCNMNSLEKAPQTKGCQSNWRSILKAHKKVRPFHLALAGGDQIYADDILTLPTVQNWLKRLGEPDHFIGGYTSAMDKEVVRFFLNLYIKYTTIPYYRKMLSAVPAMNMWDDHDIFNGFGSYAPSLQESAVFQGLRKRSREAYLLFQQHTTQLEAPRRGFFGGRGEASSFRCGLPPLSGFSYLRDLGPIAILASDQRGERTHKNIMSKESYEETFRQLANINTSCQHLYVMCAIPLILPPTGLAKCAEWIYTRMDPHKDHGSLGRALSFLAPYGVEFDLLKMPSCVTDMRDAWGSRSHLEARNAFLHGLQRFVAQRKKEGHPLRLTLLSGDLHAATAFTLRSFPLQNKFQDPNYMVQLVSSAVGSPSPSGSESLILNLFLSNEEKIPADPEEGKSGTSTLSQIIKWRAAPGKESAQEPKNIIVRRNWMTLEVEDSGDLLAHLYVEGVNNSIANPVDPSIYHLTIPRMDDVLVEKLEPAQSSRLWSALSYGGRALYDGGKALAYELQYLSSVLFSRLSMFYKKEKSE